MGEETDSFGFLLRGCCFLLATCVSACLFLLYAKMRARMPIPFCSKVLPLFGRVEVDVWPAPLLPCLTCLCCRKSGLCLAGEVKQSTLPKTTSPTRPESWNAFLGILLYYCCLLIIQYCSLFYSTYYRKHTNV